MSDKKEFSTSNAVINFLVKVTLFALIAWGIVSVLGISLPFWNLVGLSVLVGEFIAVASSKADLTN